MLRSFFGSPVAPDLFLQDLRKLNVAGIFGLALTQERRHVLHLRANINTELHSWLVVVSIDSVNMIEVKMFFDYLNKTKPYHGTHILLTI